MSLHISEQNEARLTEEAQQQGISVDTLIERLMNEHAPTVPLPGLTGSVVLAALQASPYPEIDLVPPRVRLSIVRSGSSSWSDLGNSRALQ